MRFWIGVVAFMAVLTALAAGTVAQKPHHCGVASAETVLRILGDDREHLTQRHLGLMHNARIADYRARKPYADPIEQVYPAFRETYQPILAEILLDHGYAVVNTRGSVTKDGKSIERQVVDTLIKHIKSGHLGVFHIPGHYMAITGYDSTTRMILFRDPSRPKKEFSVPLSDFIDPRRSWHTRRSGKKRPGWDGRVLFFWKPESHKDRSLNARDRCPVCGDGFPGKTYTYCRKCRAFIERRPDNQVQRGLDLIALSSDGFDQTAVGFDRMRERRKKLKHSHKISDQRWREALANYPLKSEGDRIVTLHRQAEDRRVWEEQLTLYQLERIVAGGGNWKSLLERWQSE